MATNERQKHIMEHLTLTSNLNFQGRSPGFPPEASATAITPLTPPITPDSRKKRIKEHLARSCANFNDFSVNLQQRQQQIQDHIRLSKG